MAAERPHPLGRQLLMPWHYEREGRTVGPFDDAEMIRLAEGGRIDAISLLSRDGGRTWIPSREAAPLFGLDPASLQSGEAGPIGRCSSCAAMVGARTSSTSVGEPAGLLNCLAKLPPGPRRPPRGRAEPAPASGPGCATPSPAELTDATRRPPPRGRGVPLLDGDGLEHLVVQAPDALLLAQERLAAHVPMRLLRPPAAAARGHPSRSRASVDSSPGARRRVRRRRSRPVPDPAPPPHSTRRAARR